MGFVVISGAALPGGVLGGWTTTRTAADLVGGDGWIVEGPWAELKRWPPSATARMAGDGIIDPKLLAVSIDGADWWAISDSATANRADLRTRVLAARNRRS